MHGAKSPGGKGGRPGNKNAVTHGTYETVIRDRLQPEEQVVFDAIPSEQTLLQELRILRFKLIRLLEPVEREVPIGAMAGVEIATIKLDEVTKAAAIARVVGEIRKVVKALDTSTDDGTLVELLQAIQASRAAAQTARGGV